MKNFKAVITPVNLKTTGAGSYVYRVSGSKEAIKFFEETQGDLIRYSDNDEPLFFTKNLYAFGGYITYNEEYDRFVGEPNIQSALAVQAMAVNMSFSNSGSTNSKSTFEEELEENQEPELETKAKRKVIGRRK